MFKNWFKKSNSNEHMDKPKNAAQSPEVQAMLAAKIKELKESSYASYVTALKENIIGKTVIDALTGTSGFILIFTDKTWVAAFLEETQLRWQTGSGDGYNTLNHLINSPEYGNGFNPIPIDKMYANQKCDIQAEVAHSIGQKITGLAIGANCFNFCFPDGLELNTTIVPTSEGKPALRVFWEQF